MARDFLDPSNKDGQDLFSATLPMDMLRYMISRQATCRKDGKERKTTYSDVKKAHLVPAICGVAGGGGCGRGRVRQVDPLVVWVQTGGPGLGRALFSTSRGAWQSEIAVGTCGTRTDLMAVVHGDDFAFLGLDNDLDFVLKILESPL